MTRNALAVLGICAAIFFGSFFFDGTIQDAGTLTAVALSGEDPPDNLQLQSILNPFNAGPIFLIGLTFKIMMFCMIMGMLKLCGILDLVGGIVSKTFEGAGVFFGGTIDWVKAKAEEASKKAEVADKVVESGPDGDVVSYSDMLTKFVKYREQTKTVVNAFKKLKALVSVIVDERSKDAMMITQHQAAIDQIAQIVYDTLLKTEGVSNDKPAPPSPAPVPEAASILPSSQKIEEESAPEFDQLTIDDDDDDSFNVLDDDSETSVLSPSSASGIGSPQERLQRLMKLTSGGSDSKANPSTIDGQ